MAIASTLAGAAALWLAGDAIHAGVTTWRRHRFEQRIQRDADGIRAGCRAYTLGKGDTAILLLHGFGSSPHIWRNVAPELAQAGFTVRAMRLPGFAEPIHRYRKTDRRQWRQAVLAELAELRAGHRRVVLAAFSLGGACAIDALIAAPRAADAVVLIAPLCAVSSARSPLLAPAAWFRLLDPLLLFTRTLPVDFPPDLHDAAERPRMKNDRFVPRTVYRELFALLKANRRRAGQFVTPMTMILSEHDRVISNDDAETFHARCAAPDPAPVIRFADSGHMLPVDHDWRHVAREIAATASSDTVTLPQM